MMINFLNAELAYSCGGADVLRIIKFVFTLLDIVLFVIPVGLIIMLMVDFGKNVIAGKEDEMKKNVNIAIKRIMYCVVLFLVPTIVNFAISIVADSAKGEKNAVEKAAACVNLAKKSSSKDFDKWEVDYENDLSVLTK